MKENFDGQVTGEEPGTENEPQVYSPQRGPEGWSFNRRYFVTLAAAAAVGAVVGVGGKVQPALARVVSMVGQSSDPPLADLEEGQPFTKVWKFKNTGSEPWGRDASLQLRQGESLTEPLTIDLPNANPGQVVTVTVPMVAPAGLQPTKIEASIHLTGTTYSVFLPAIYGLGAATSCTCDGHSPCTCESYVPCTCDPHIPCTCDAYFEPPCVCEHDIIIPCPCEYHVPCGCVTYVPSCGCDYYNPCGCVYFF